MQGQCLLPRACAALFFFVFSFGAISSAKADDCDSPSPTDCKTWFKRVEITGKSIGPIKLEPWPLTTPQQPMRLGAGAPSAARAQLPSDTNAPSDDCQSPQSGNPVIIATGEKVKHEVDIRDFTEEGLSFKRTYRSSGAASGLFGSRWSSSWDAPQLSVVQGPCPGHSSMSCSMAPRLAVFMLPDGTRKSFVTNLGARYRPNGATTDGTTWGAVEIGPYTGTAIIDNKTYRFAMINGRTGRLTDILKDGQVLYTYNYNTGGQLASVVHRSGRSISFGWVGGRVVSVTDLDGRVWSYGYNGSGMLLQVVPPAGTSGVRTYHYENGSDATLLTGISVDGVRSTRYSYDTSRRVTRSGTDNGEDVDTFVYGSNTTTLTDSFGQRAVYSFQNTNSFKRLTGVDRLATSTCPVAASSIAYDANGYQDYTIDWRGIKTDHTYNANGQLTERVRAAGTARAFRETFTWSTGSQMTEVLTWGGNGSAFRKTTYTYDSKQRVVGATVTDLRTGQVRSQTIAYADHGNNVLASRTVTVNLSGTSAVSVERYDTRGYLVSASNAAGHTTTYSDHNGYGLPHTIADQNGVITRLPD